MEVQPAGADSCTQTNKSDVTGQTVRFKKDFSRVKIFVQEVRRAEKIMLEEELNNLREQLRDREAALPAHSIRPHQLQLIEELEDEIISIEKRLAGLRS
jgi:hypothetical protein